MNYNKKLFDKQNLLFFSSKQRERGHEIKFRALR